jgi:hypothetical protein
MAGCTWSMTRWSLTGRSAARRTVNGRVGSVARRLRRWRSWSVASGSGGTPGNLAEPWRQRLPRSRKNLSRPGRRRTWLGRNRYPSRPWRGQRRGDRPCPRARRQRRTHRRNQWPCRSKTCGSFHALLRGFDGGSCGDHRRRGEPYRLRLAHALLSDRSFVVHDRHRGALAPRGFFHCRFASQAPPHQYDLIILQRTGVRFLVGDPQIRKQLKNRAGFNFQFPSQLVDANFAHTLRLWRGKFLPEPEVWYFPILPFQLNHRRYATALHFLS